jgi:hypothetical protein
VRKLQYAGGGILVGDRTCKALLRYSRALANAGKSDVVSVPYLTEGGTRAFAHLIIGPASQIFSTPIEDATEDPDDWAVIEKLEQQSLLLEPSRPAWPQEMDDIPGIEELIQGGEL